MNTATFDPLGVIREAVATERGRSGSVKAALARVATLFGLSPRRVYAVWYGQPVRLEWEEAERIRMAARASMARELADIEARQAVVRAKLKAYGA